jgi:hypothetical protein
MFDEDPPENSPPFRRLQARCLGAARDPKSLCGGQNPLNQ